MEVNDQAVIVLGMLNDFVTCSLKCERAKNITHNLKKLLAAARKNKVPVIYSNDAHLAVDEEVIERWGKHAIKGTIGARAPKSFLNCDHKKPIMSLRKESTAVFMKQA